MSIKQNNEIRKLIKRQEELSKKVISEDGFRKIKIIGANAQVPRGNVINSVVVVLSYPDLKILDVVHSKFKTDFSYTSGLLVYREGPPVILTYKRLKVKPNVLLLNCSGVCHPRFFGMASHIGVLLDIPTIGVTKSLLCGVVRDGKIFYKGKQVGWSFKNIYISPGHKVSLDSSLEIVKKIMRGHRLPEPLYLAKKYARILNL